MLLAVDFLLLVTDDTSGRLLAPAGHVDAALGGANLIELTWAGKVSLAGGYDGGKPGRLAICDATPLGDPVLDAAMETAAAHQGKRPATVIKPAARKLRQTLYERLAASGAVYARQDRLLGLFPSHRWPAQDPGHKAAVRRLVTEALLGQTAPDTRTAALIGLLHALRCEHKVVDPAQGGLSRRQLRARAQEIADSDQVSRAVRKVIEDTAAAVAAMAAAASTGAG